MSAFASAIYHIPIFGWLLKEAVYGPPDAKYYFVANVLVFVVALIYRFGYPLLICMALAASVVILTTIVILTAMDLFESRAKVRRRRQVRRAQNSAS